MRNQTRLVLTGGLVAGLVGYGTVVLVMAIMNVVLDRSPFYTAALFGSVLFYDLRDPAALVITAGPVLAYNMMHLVAFLALGTIASWLVTLSERYPSAQYFILVVLVFIAFHVYGAMMLFAHSLLGGSAWWEIGLGTAAAAVTMAAYLVLGHPFLRRELREIPMGDVPPEMPEAP
jgi:hypothetical protein